MATTARKQRRRALVSAALLSTAPALFGCAETEQPAPDAGTGQTTTPPQKTDESPEASAPAREEAGGSTATTIRASASGAQAMRAASSPGRGQRASGRSSISSPSSSWRPSRVPA